MGKLVKNHWARLLALSAAACQLLAGIEAFFWPKIFIDFWTTKIDVAVKPFPILQSVNVLFALVTLAYEWPLPWIAGSFLHRSLVVRIVWLTLAAVSCTMLYQATNPALYYLVTAGVYVCAYMEREVIPAEPWTLPDESTHVPGKA